jgi:glycosyltransferase involved in cell wall biosynthesis
LNHAVRKTHIEISLKEPIPEQFAVGRGQYQLIQGKIFCADFCVNEVRINQSGERDCRVELFSGSEPNILEFFIYILWSPDDVGPSHHLILTLVVEAQETKKFDLGSVELVDADMAEVESGSTLGDAPLIAICLASYNPAGNRLARQIESILCQSYENWLLIISDDNSAPAQLGKIEALCNLDPRRIRLYRHDQNLGFYRNFERALKYVPDNAELIALADQDDEWFPEKLQNLADELNRQVEAMLVYSDMRIVSELGEIISNTYWQNRKNEYRDFGTVFIANTVTGAASLFKRELLEVALPFPERVGNAFHDHWIACCALSQGKLAYVLEPQYDYIQYDDSVIGQCDFTAKPLSTRLSNSLLGQKGNQAASSLKWEQVYRYDCLRLQLIAKTLKLRVPALSGNFVLNLMNGGRGSAFKLMLVYLKNRLMRRTTNGAELGLLMGFVRGKGDRDCSDKTC